MSSDTLSVVPYDPSHHEEAFYRMVEKVLGPEKCALRRRVIDTIHSTMPLRERTPLRHVIVDGDRIAGAMGHLPADFLIEGRRVEARFTHDLLVDPDYRGRGLAKMLVQNAADTGEFLPGGMWMNDPCYRIHLASGFDSAQPLTTYTLVLDPAGFVARKEMSAFKGTVTKAGLSVTRRRAVERAEKEEARASAAGELQTVAAFDPALDAAWERMALSYGAVRVRDAAYLNWKYANHPNLDYRCVVATRAGTPAGFMAWRLPIEGAAEKRAVIADFLVAREDAATLRTLVSSAIVESVRSGLETLSILTTQPWAIRMLRGHGFFPRGGTNTWAVGGWRDRVEQEWLSSHDPWHICLGDSDGDIWTGSQ